MGLLVVRTHVYGPVVVFQVLRQVFRFTGPFDQSQTDFRPAVGG